MRKTLQVYMPLDLDGLSVFDYEELNSICSQYKNNIGNVHLGFKQLNNEFFNIVKESLGDEICDEISKLKDFINKNIPTEALVDLKDDVLIYLQMPLTLNSDLLFDIEETKFIHKTICSLFQTTPNIDVMTGWGYITSNNITILTVPIDNNLISNLEDLLFDKIKKLC